jgi:hypothetical protein
MKMREEKRETARRSCDPKLFAWSDAGLGEMPRPAMADKDDSQPCQSNHL